MFEVEVFFSHVELDFLTVGCRKIRGGEVRPLKTVSYVEHTVMYVLYETLRTVPPLYMCPKEIDTRVRTGVKLRGAYSWTFYITVRPYST
jgi:hypothetical protein